MASDNVFCIGNGESRKGFDLETLRPHGKIYGCNALYRDFMPDALIGVDHGIMHEIYHAGVAQKIPCYFRGWTKLPAMTYDDTLLGGCDVIEAEKIKGDAVIENERNGSQEFVIHGSNLMGVATILKKNKEKTQKEIKHALIHVSWMQQPDLSKSIDDIMQPKDRGWAAGATAGYMAVANEQPRRLFMIGNDLNSSTNKLNNIYKGTKHYAPAEQHPTPSVNWIKQWRELMNEHPHIQFYKVNEKGLGTDQVNRTIDEWEGIKNLKYILYQDMLDILSKV